MLKKISIVGIADLSIRLKAFLFIAIISKMLGMGAYGVWAQIMVTVTMLLPVVILGMPFGILRYIPGESAKDRRDDVNSILFIVLIASGIGAVALIFMSHFLSKSFFGGNEFSYTLKLAAFYLILMSLREVFMAYFRARENIFIYSLLVFLDSVLSVLIVAYSIYLGYGINGALFALIVLNIITTIIALFAVKIDAGIALPLFINIKKYLSYSLPFLPIIWLLWVVNSSDRYFLGYFKTIRDVGIYSVCYGLSYFVVNLVIGPLYVVMQPRIVSAWNNNNPAQASKLICELVKYAVFFMFPCAIGFIVVARTVVPYFTSPDSANGVIIVPFILAGYIFYLIAVCLEIGAYLSSEPRKMINIYIITAFLNILLNIILIPNFGMLGAAISTTFSFFIHLLLIVYRVSRKMALDIDYKILCKISLAALFMGFVISKIPHGNIFQVGLVIICGIILYSGLLFLLKVFNELNLTQVRNLIYGHGK